MDRLNQSQSLPRGRPVSSVDAAKANDVLEHFISAATLKTILGNYRNICELLHLKPNVFPLFYPKLRANLNSWKAKALWKKFDARASHKCYARGKVCPNTRVLIIGAGPCGLRTAIEAQLLGAKVVVIEKRDRNSRNNVLHLWPFVIEDLRALGAKKFFGKFCAGAIDHISIRQLQCILLKVALLLGVEVHTEVSFEKLIEPNSTEKIGWRAEFKPSDHPVSQYEFDVIIGADGKRNTLQGFKRKEFRGKLAIAITANFINKRTEAEARVEEISGVAFIFNQKFFKELNAETGIDLENIVYYKDDTHYFVMTAKKHSLIDKGVIKQDYADTARLLSPDNVDRDNLMEYAREAAEFSTNYQMPDLEFAVNHYGQPDVAMFDFTSMYAAENASKFIERNGYKLLMILVGDSLLEPFWPTGSGCARGFLSSLDACWAIKAWGSGLTTPLEVLAERESIYRLLAQTTPENLNKDCKAYTVDPSTRYPNLNRAVLVPQQVLSLYDTDDPSGIELTSRIPQPAATVETHRKRRRRDVHLDPNTLINWIKDQVKEHEDLTVEDITTSFRDGRVLCAILHHYRPDLLDYSAIKPEDVAKNNQLAFDLLEKEIGISPVMTGEDMENSEVPDYLTMFSYLTQIYDTFRGEIPHIKHPKLHILPSKVNVPKFGSRTTTTLNDSKCQRHMPNFEINTTKVNTKAAESSKRESTIHKPSSIEMKIPKTEPLFELRKSKAKFSIQTMENKATASKNIKPQFHLEVKMTPKRRTIMTTCDSLQNSGLNFTPLKSLEERIINYDSTYLEERKNEDKDFNIFNYNNKHVQDIKNMQILNASEESDEIFQLRFFDENFKELDQVYEVACQTSRANNEAKKLNVIVNGISTNTCTDIKENENRLHTNFENSGFTNDNINQGSLTSSRPSEILVRHVEEGSNSVCYQELHLQSHPHALTINVKPVKRKHIKRMKFKNQVRSMFLKNKPKVECHKSVCRVLDKNRYKFLYKGDMSSAEVSPRVTHDRIIDWLNVNNFEEGDGFSEIEADPVERLTDITSVTKTILKENEAKVRSQSTVLEDIKVEKCTEEVKFSKETPHSHSLETKSLDSMAQFVENVKSNIIARFSEVTPWHKLQPWLGELQRRFPVINETEERELPDTKEYSRDFIKIPQTSSVRTNDTTTALVGRFTTSRTKRHAEAISSSKPTVMPERKTKKRRSFEKYEMSVNVENMWSSFWGSIWESMVVCFYLLLMDFTVNYKEYLEE